MKNNFKIYFFLMLMATLALGGCGGNSVTATSEGQFIDAAVEGIAYTSGGQTGFTDANGRFTYENGQSVTFSIGDIVIGSASGKAIVTPVDLVAGAVDETNAEVTNIVQFLITIDDDNDLSNGIQVTQVIHDAAAGKSADFTATDFDTDSNVSSVVDALTTVSTIGSRVLVDTATAQNHLSDSLFSLIAGTYSGTFSGTDSGTWQVTINTAGVVSGTGNSISIGDFNIAGSITSSGTLGATTSGTAASSTWAGSIDISSGAVSGTWSDLGSQSGTISGG